MRKLIKSIIKWIAVDGLLHFLVCYALMLTFTPIVGIWWAVLITVIPAIAKELWDGLIQKDNDIRQIAHDLVCDGVGMLGAIVIMLIM